MKPPPPSNQPALDRILAEVNELSYEDSKGAWDIITRLKTLKATPAPAGDDAVRGLVERLETTRSELQEDAFPCRPHLNAITDAIEALQRLAGENAHLKMVLDQWDIRPTDATPRMPCKHKLAW